MKLFDNLDFQSPPPFFDHSLQVDFVNYNELETLSSATIYAIAESYNQTPTNFQSLNDEQILKVLKQIENEITTKESERIEDMERFNHEIQNLQGPSRKKARLMSEEDAKLFH